MADARDIEAARGDVGRDQRADASAAHVRKRAGALELIHIAVQRRGGVAFAAQTRRERLRIALGGDKDDALGHRHVGQQVVEDPVLVCVIVGEMHSLLDRGRRRLVGIDFDTYRVAEQLAGEARDRRVERRREQHRLALLRRARRNQFHVVDEPHVQHPVGFVEYEHLQLRQIDAAALEMVDEPTWGGDENVDSARELAVLDRIRRAAVDANGLQTQVAPVLHSLSGYLLGKLARWRQYQHTRTARRAMRRWNAWRHRRQSLQRGKHKGRGLAGAGLSRSDHVTPCKQRWDGLRLDRRGFGVAAVGKCAQQFRYEF